MDAARTLITRFEDCEWRETKFQIIHELALFPDQRTLEFLFSLARESTDLPLASAAISALGRTHDRVAAKFLNQLYSYCDEALKPVVAGAIGLIPDPTLGLTFHSDLKKALKEGKPLLARNLILTLGELKLKFAEAALFEVIERNELDVIPAIRQACLVSLGKISRNIDRFEKLEKHFSNDLLEYQIFLSVMSQIRFRSQWTLEDYLSKIFSGNDLHRSVPLELMSFDEKDVHEGLKLFFSHENFEKICFALSGLHTGDVSVLYKDLKKLISTEKDRVKYFESLKAHHGPWLDSLLMDEVKTYETTKGETDNNKLGALVELASVAHSEPALFFTKITALSRLWNSENKVILINALVTSGQIHKNVKKEFEAIKKLLLNELKEAQDQKLAARIIRAFGQLGISDDKIVSLNLLEKEPQSVLYYLENNPDAKTRDVVLSNLEAFKTDELSASVLSALKNAKLGDQNEKQLLPIIKRCLTAGPECKKSALQYLASHPDELFYESIVKLAQEQAVVLYAVIALKSLNKEESADVLKTCLESKTKEVSGRALDALCSLKGVRAKRLVFDYLKVNSDDTDVVSKVIRSLAMPETGHQYFIDSIDEMLKLNPAHIFRDGWIDLRDRIKASEKSKSKNTDQKNSKEIDAADLELQKALSSYVKLDENVKSALRSAEVPFSHQEFYQGKVDKASSVLEYCKALDLFFERHFGRNYFFGKIEKSLHEFQNVIHSLSLQDEMVSTSTLIKVMGLERSFTPESLPLHKMQMMSKAILSGRIIGDRFKVLDGLRAWGVILLLFSRKNKLQHSKVLLPVSGLDDEKIVNIAKRLMKLQDIRNPAAHRETFFEYSNVEEVRNEVIRLLKELEAVL